MAFHRPGKLPLPEFFMLTQASEHDLNAFRQILLQLPDRAFFADKAYSNRELKFLKFDNRLNLYSTG